MDKNEILARSRKENRGRDMVELEAMRSAMPWSFVVSTLVSCGVAVAWLLVTGRVNAGVWMVYLSTQCTVFWIKWAKLRRGHELAMALLYSAAFLCMTTAFVIDLVRHGG